MQSDSARETNIGHSARGVGTVQPMRRKGAQRVEEK
jgi:hypothetical protein